MRDKSFLSLLSKRRRQYLSFVQGQQTHRPVQCRTCSRNFRFWLDCKLLTFHRPEPESLDNPENRNKKDSN